MCHHLEYIQNCGDCVASQNRLAFPGIEPLPALVIIAEEVIGALFNSFESCDETKENHFDLFSEHYKRFKMLTFDVIYESEEIQSHYKETILKLFNQESEIIPAQQIWLPLQTSIPIILESTDSDKRLSERIRKLSLDPLNFHLIPLKTINLSEISEVLVQSMETVGEKHGIFIPLLDFRNNYCNVAAAGNSNDLSSLSKYMIIISESGIQFGTCALHFIVYRYHFLSAKLFNVASSMPNPSTMSDDLYAQSETVSIDSFLLIARFYLSKFQSTQGKLIKVYHYGVWEQLRSAFIKGIINKIFSHSNPIFLGKFTEKMLPLIRIFYTRFENTNDSSKKFAEIIDDSAAQVFLQGKKCTEIIKHVLTAIKLENHSPLPSLEKLFSNESMTAVLEMFSEFFDCATQLMIASNIVSSEVLMAPSNIESSQAFADYENLLQSAGKGKEAQTFRESLGGCPVTKENDTGQDFLFAFIRAQLSIRSLKQEIQRNQDEVPPPMDTTQGAAGPSPFSEMHEGHCPQLCASGNANNEENPSNESTTNPTLSHTAENITPINPRSPVEYSAEETREVEH